MTTRNKNMDNDFILKKLEQEGFESYLVGGYVRDILLGIESQDYDIATSANPNQILDVFKEFTTIDIGKKFGTIKVIVENQDYEITSFRKETGYKDKRHPDKIEFTSNILEDLRRRDFTINAMALRNNQILDPFKGRDDLTKGIIRSVGNPYDRIEEDSLRSLRAIRFAGKLNFDLDIDLKKAIKNKVKNIQEISKERIVSEVDKILMLYNPVKSIKLMDEVGLLKYIFPEIEQMKNFNQHSSFHDMDLFEHTMSVLSFVKGDLETRLAALFHDTGKLSTMFIDENGEGRFFGHQSVSEKIIKDRLTYLKYPKKIIENSSILVKRHMDNTNLYTKKSIRKLLRKIGKENLLRLFDLQIADVLSTNHKDISNIENGIKILEECEKENLPSSRKDIKINGNDLIKLGFKPSKQFGDLLREIEELIYDEKLENEKSQIIKYIKNKYISVD